MKLSVQTAAFQNMVAKATKGAVMNKDLFITQLMAIQLRNDKLTLITTDNSNYLYVSEKLPGEDFYVVVQVDKFSKLISKLTCDVVELELVSKEGQLDKLVVNGNGRHVLELPYDEDGDLIEFPDPVYTTDTSDWKAITTKLSTIKMVLSTAKPALSASADTCYSGYYMGDCIVSTNTYKICGIDIKMFDEPKLLPPQLIDLLDVMTEEDITVQYSEDSLIFSTPSVIVYGKTMSGIEDYKIDAIQALLNEPFPSSCKIDKSLLLQILDRASLFVDTYDKNGIYLTFTKDGIMISNKKDKGEEIIPYKESSDFEAYTCCLDIDLFKTQVKAYPSELLEILYGKQSLKFVVGNVKQFVALSVDDRAEQGE